MTTPGTARTAKWVAAGAVVVAVVAIVTGWSELPSSWLPWGDRAIQGTELDDFPSIDTAALTPTQAKVLGEAEKQFDSPASPSTYAEGADESWCADFVSWVMRDAGRPLSNPNSGSWRIPGVYTLQEYYQSAGRFHEAGYSPRPGDVIMYNTPSPFGQHTNIVLGFDGRTVTTIGGNENGRIRLHEFTLADDPGVVGFGVLQ